MYKSWWPALAIILLLAIGARCHAQLARFRLMAGMGAGFVAASGTKVVYSPVLLPHVAAYYTAPMGARFAFVTGLAYLQKGFTGRNEVRSIPDDDLDIYQGRTRYDFLSIPLQLAFRLRASRSHSLWLGGGMNYGIMMRAQTDWTMTNYRHGKFRYRNEYISRPPIGLLPSDNRIPPVVPGHYASLYRFNPAVTGSLNFAWRKRYLLSVFYEYNLYDVSSEPAIGKLQLQSAGLLGGVGF